MVCYFKTCSVVLCRSQEYTASLVVRPSVYYTFKNYFFVWDDCGRMLTGRLSAFVRGFFPSDWHCMVDSLLALLPNQTAGSIYHTIILAYTFSVVQHNLLHWLLCCLLFNLIDRVTLAVMNCYNAKFVLIISDCSNYGQLGIIAYNTSFTWVAY